MIRASILSSLPHRAWTTPLLTLLWTLCQPMAVYAVSNARLPTPNVTSCFSSPPSCRASSDLSTNEDNNPSYDLGNYTVQDICSFLDIHFLYYYEVVWDLDQHIDALAELQMDTPECDAALQVYHECYWCLPKSDPDYERRYDFCLLEDDICAIPNDPPDAHIINSTCIELEEILSRNLSFPASLDVCKRAEASLFACDFYCQEGYRNPEYVGGTPTNASCWTFEDPPDCGTDVDFNHPPADLDLQTECEFLLLMMADGWYSANQWTHVYAFHSIQAGTDQCERSRRAYPYCAICHPLQQGNDNFCQFDHVCQDAGHRKPIVKDMEVDMRASCIELEQMYDAKVNFPATADLCYRAEMTLHACPFWCETPYLGADTTAKKWALVGLARASAFLSLLGAIYIVYDILAVRKHRRTVYHQLLLAMAVFDMVTAVAWSFSTAPLPLDEAWQIVGVVGNDATCKAQAFFIQLGFTSIFYNASLALYYVLVIVHRWRENDLKKIRPYMHAGPLLVGFSLACAILPYADWTGYGCHIVPPPDDDRWKSLVFVVIPLGISVLAITAAMAHMYFQVRQNARASRKWSFGVGSHLHLETQVFWQSLLYTLSFYVTWPIMFAVYLGSIDYKLNSFALTATVSFVAPLQGFSNFLVYLRPKLMTKRGQKVQRMSATNLSTSMFGFARRSTVGRKNSSSVFASSLSRGPAVSEAAALAADEEMDPSARIAFQQSVPIAAETSGAHDKTPPLSSPECAPTRPESEDPALSSPPLATATSNRSIEFNLTSASASKIVVVEEEDYSKR